MAIETFTITTVQVKRGLAASWTSQNPILLDGEIGYESDTYKMKVGDGVTAWTSLSYLTGTGIISGLADLSDVGTATAANRYALLGTGTQFNARALVLADVSDFSYTSVVSGLDTELAQTRWKAIEVPSGGSSGQVLKKNSGTNYDVGWANDTAATTASSVTITDTGAYYAGGDVEAALDEIGTTFAGLTVSDITDLTATASEINGVADLAGLTAGWVYSADTSTTASWKAPTGSVDISGTPVTLDFARFTDADTIEGRSYSEVRADLGLVIGTNVLAEQTIGIADNNLLEVDGTPLTTEYARFTATGLEGRTEAEFKADFNLEIGTDVQAYDATNVTDASTSTLTNKTFDANGTGNSISNIDVTDLANGTDGELITWSATGVATTVAVGTATHVLTSNGVGAAPTFQAAAGGSSLPVVDTTSIVEGSADNTKELRIEVDGLTTATTRVWTAPDADITVAGINLAQTWTAIQDFDADIRLSDAGVLDSGNGGIHLGEDYGISGKRWRIIKDQISEDMEFALQDAAATTRTGTYTDYYTLHASGVPTNATDLTDKDYVDATTGTGTAFDISKMSGTFYNMGAANAGTTYTFTNATTGGWAQGLINAASEPTVTSGTKEGGAQFVASTDMYLTIYNNGTGTKYYFTAISVGDTAYPAEMGIAVSDETSDLTTGTAKATFRMPYAMTLNEVRANVNTGGSGTGTITVDINEDGTSVLSTKLTIDSGTNGTAILTLTGNAVDTETCVIDGKTYTFQDTLTNTDGNVHIGAAATNTLDNLIGAITLTSGTSGTDYAASTTVHPSVTAAAGAGDTMDVTAKVASSTSLTTSETMTNGSWDGNVDGGADPELTSQTAATAAVISDSALADDAEITIDIDSLGSDDAGKGLKVWLIGTRA